MNIVGRVEESPTFIYKNQYENDQLSFQVITFRSDVL